MFGLYEGKLIDVSSAPVGATTETLSLANVGADAWIKPGSSV